MKKFASLLLVSMLGGILTLGSYKLFLEDDYSAVHEPGFTSTGAPNFMPVSYDSSIYGTNADFTEAAEKTVHGVVHVKNVTHYRMPGFNIRDNSGKAIRGAGSGVIITQDGYIVTNNHVIDGASELQVTLNNNKTYTAEVIGTDAKTDIAVIKIEEEDLDYLTFGNSNNVKLGEWALAVGNPFNLTSTVTAGIISAKARDFNNFDNSPQSFIQTDAAINPGNSGGALVNINGELIGINTAITSQTGSYIGYGFAVPSNNVRKIVEDILEYGNVQQGILGIRGGDLNQGISQQLDLSTSQGVIVSDVDAESGAAKAGIRPEDVIIQIDEIPVRKMSDLTGYIGSKRPDDIVHVTVLRDDKEISIEVKLTKYETYDITAIGLEITNASQTDLQKYKVRNGVKISRPLTGDRQSQDLVGIIITKIDNQNVSNVSDVRKILNSKNPEEPISVTFVNHEGKEQTYIWR